MTPERLLREQIQPQPPPQQGACHWCVFGWCRQMDTDVEELCCGLQQCVSQQPLRIHHITITKEYYNTYTKKAQNIQTCYIIKCVHSLYGLHLALHSLLQLTQSFTFVLGSLHSRFVPSLMSSFDLLVASLSFIFLPRLLLMGRVLRLMCPNHFSFRSSSINGVSPVISLSSLMGYN